MRQKEVLLIIPAYNEEKKYRKGHETAGAAGDSRYC